MLNKSFTVIEMLVIIGVMGILSTIMLLYNRGTSQLVVLDRGVAKITSDISNAREMSLGFVSEKEGKKACGIGIHFLPPPSSEYYLFVDLVPESGNCSNSDHIWTNDAETLRKLFFEENAFISSKSFSDVLFIPPDPNVLFDNNKNVSSGSLVVKAGNYQKTITITKAGQISY